MLDNTKTTEVGRVHYCVLKLYTTDLKGTWLSHFEIKEVQREVPDAKSQ